MEAVKVGGTWYTRNRLGYKELVVAFLSQARAGNRFARLLLHQKAVTVGFR